jgi:PAS domain-containing protein
MNSSGSTRAQFPPSSRRFSADVVNQGQEGEPTAAPGQVHSWLASYSSVRLHDEIIGLGLFVVDITERKQAEDFRSVVIDNMVEGLTASDGEGRLGFMNAAACRMLGWTEDELRGKSLHAAAHFQHGDTTSRRRPSVGRRKPRICGASF